MPVLHDERAAVEKRLAQVAIDLGLHVAPKQQNSLVLKQASLANSAAEMSVTSPSKDNRPGMKCRKCNTRLRPRVAAESIQKFNTLCQALGMAPERVDALADQHGPLCMRCLAKWGTGEDDLDPTPRR